MSSRGRIFFWAIIFACFFILPSKAWAYDTNIAHPNIATLAAELYNQNFTEKLTAEEIGWIKQGAMAEDTPTRWLNHFYDPVHDLGLKGQYLSAKDWAGDYNEQRNFSLGDQSWLRALDDFRKGNRELAFKELGHTIHLISDMAVPAHTRDDIHVIGDSYEQFVKNNWSKISANLGLSAVKISDLSGAFDSLANFSNNNFYSDDTIEDNKFSIIKINEYNAVKIDDDLFMFAISGVGNGRLKLYVTKSPTKWKGLDSESNNLNHPLVLTDYTTHLIPKAVGYSAGIIKLFMDEAKKNEKTDLPTFRITLRGLADSVGGAVIAGAEQLYDNLKSKTAPASLAQNNGEMATADGPAETAKNLTLANAPEQTPIEPAKKSEDKKIETTIKPSPSISNLPPPIQSMPATPQISSKPQVTVPAVSNHAYYYGGGGGGGGGGGNSISPIFQEESVPSQTTGQGGAGETPSSTTSTSPTSTPTPTSSSTTTATTSTPDSAPTTTPDNSSDSSTSTPTTTPSIPPPDTTPPPAPLLDNLFAEIIYTTSSGANIFGSVSTDTVKILSYYSVTPTTHPSSSPQSSDGAQQEGNPNPSSTRFDFGAVFNSGHNYFYFAALDEAGNTSSLSLPAHFVFDTESPTVPVVAIDNQTNASSTNLRLTVNSSDSLSPTIFYDIVYRLSTTSTWQDLAVATTTNQFDFTGSRGQSYLFRARAKDGLGNTSSWSDENASSTPTFVDWSKEIVINEVAWAGNSAQYPNDEWLELYNNTDSPIDLRQWKIMVSGRSMNWSTSTVANPFIAPHGYYLLERTYDNNVRDIADDLIYTLQSGFKNTGEKLELFKPGGIKVDEVDCSAGWFAGDTIKYRTMERINPAKSGNDKNNWQANQGPRVIGRSYNGGYLYGSPRQSNFGFIMLGGSQEDSTTTFTAANSPYVLIDYTVPAGKTLKIEPGVVIKAYWGSKMDIYGSLEAKGTADKPIIFTTGRDHSFADTSLDTIVGTWSTTTPRAKDWQGLWFRAGSIGTLEHIELRYAGYDFRPPPGNLLYSQAVRADSATVNISHSTFNTTGDTIVYLNSSTSTISGSNFQNGVLAVDAQQSDLTLTGSNFTNFSNSRGPVNIKGKWPVLGQLTFFGNASDMVYLESANIDRDVTYPKELNYLVMSNLQVLPSTTFNLEPGSVLNLAKYGAITFQGTLQAPGTAETPIIIQPSPTNTSWGYVKFDGSTSNLSHVNFIRGNLLPSTPANLDGALLIYNSNVTLDNCSVQDSRPPGNSIQTGNSTVTIRNSQIIKAQKYAGQYVSDVGIKINSGQLNLDNVLFNNFNIGLLGINNGSLPGLQMSNMSPSSFVNIDYPIQPTNWFSFPTSTP